MGTLTERIKHPDRREADLEPVVERRGGTERRTPRWVERMQDGELPAKDFTPKAAA